VLSSDFHVLFHQACGKNNVAQPRYRFTWRLSESKDIAAVIGFNDRPGEKPLLG
jgi:hypothetical protein